MDASSSSQPSTNGQDDQIVVPIRQPTVPPPAHLRHAGFGRSPPRRHEEDAIPLLPFTPPNRPRPSLPAHYYLQRPLYMSPDFESLSWTAPTEDPITSAASHHHQHTMFTNMVRQRSQVSATAPPPLSLPAPRRPPPPAPAPAPSLLDSHGEPSDYFNELVDAWNRAALPSPSSLFPAVPAPTSPGPNRPRRFLRSAPAISQLGPTATTMSGLDMAVDRYDEVEDMRARGSPIPRRRR